MKTQTEIQIEIEATDKAVSALKADRAALPKNDDSLAARRLDSEIEEGLGRIATLSDEMKFKVTQIADGRKQKTVDAPSKEEAIRKAFGVACDIKDLGAGSNYHAFIASGLPYGPGTLPVWRVVSL